MANKVGEISSRVIDLLNLNMEPGTPIYIGEANVKHMKSRHRTDYELYGHLIEEILDKPDYIGGREDGSVEYVKKVYVDNSYVKVAVRVSSRGTCFARTLYKLNENRVKNFIKKGTLVKY